MLEKRLLSAKADMHVDHLERSHLLVSVDSMTTKPLVLAFAFSPAVAAPYVFGFVIRATTSVPSARLSRNVRVSPGFSFMNG